MPDIFNKDSHGGESKIIQLITVVGVGTTIVLAHTIPTNKIVQFCGISSSYVGIVNGVSVNYGIRRSAIDYIGNSILSVIANMTYGWSMPGLWLQPGDIVLAQILGVTIGGQNYITNCFINEFTPD